MKRGLLLVVCSACGVDGGHGIAGFGGVELELYTVGTDLERVSLGKSAGGCRVLDSSLVGSYGGLEMTVDSYGDVSAAGCVIPTLSVSPLASPLSSSTVEVHDRTASIVATYAPGVLDRRAMTPRSHTTWQFAAGDPVALAWSRPEDLTGATRVTVTFSLGPLSDTMPVPYWKVPGTIEADAITFTVPAVPAASGAGLLDVFVEGPIAAPESCVGATACVIMFGTGAVHDATVTL